MPPSPRPSLGPSFLTPSALDPFGTRYTFCDALSELGARVTKGVARSADAAGLPAEPGDIVCRGSPLQKGPRRNDNLAP
ncbi:hypothetical protein GCM10027416_17630 [Okibacterium endophyticum]